MKTLLCLFFISILAATSGSGTLQAQKPVKVGDMYYRIQKDKTAVSIVGGDVKTTSFTIPSQVTIEGKVYPIERIENINKKWNKLQPRPWGNIVQKIIVPSSVKEIGDGAFYGQEELKEIVLPKSITDIGYNAFGYCGIKAIDLSDTQISWLNMSCFSPHSLDSISLPKTLHNISSPIHNVWSDNLFVSIDYKVFNKLVDLVIRNSSLWDFLRAIKRLEIRDATILKCNYLKEKLKSVRELTLLAPVKEIGDRTFSYCDSLKYVKIPPSVTKIGDYAFAHCPRLVEIKGLNSNITYGVHYRNDMFTGTPFRQKFDEVQKSFSYYALGLINKDLAEWKEKKEIETAAQWEARVTPEARDKRVKRLLEEAKLQYIKNRSPKTLPECFLEKFDTDYNTYPLDFKELGKQYVHVPPDEAPAFKANLIRSRIQPTYGIKNDQLAIVSVSVQIGNKTYRSVAPAEDDSTPLLVDLPPLDISFGDNRKLTKETNIDNDVDTNIPTTNTVADKTFAVIIANEAYTHEVKVPFALNDGEVFARYCQKTLGIPEKNIQLVKNATLNDIKFHLNWLAQVLAAYNGTAKAIVYYAGHGIPDEKQQSAYLLPADGYGSDPSTAYALQDFYAMLNNAQARNITVFLDACFSGAKRENGMLASARGVAIKVRQEIPRGKMVIFTAAQGDETAYQYAEKGHGMFTYFLLKKLQESQGNTTLGELSDYVTDEVKKNSIVNNKKLQTPTVIPAEGMVNTWEKVTLK